MKERGKSKWKSLFKSLLLDNAKQRLCVQASFVLAHIVQLSELIVCNIVEVLGDALHPVFYCDVCGCCATSIGMELVVRCGERNKLTFGIECCDVISE